MNCARRCGIIRDWDLFSRDQRVELEQVGMNEPPKQLREKQISVKAIPMCATPRSKWGVSLTVSIQNQGQFQVSFRPNVGIGSRISLKELWIVLDEPYFLDRLRRKYDCAPKHLISPSWFGSIHWPPTRSGCPPRVSDCPSAQHNLPPGALDFRRPWTWSFLHRLISVYP